ncbi:hypothetical protein HEB94_000153 [Actinopolymorpha pittospori]|uniref:Uncharacterized protein n=1 Tax=Actinopolymorpha pittospori TaxID=648752 RepID=A0A927MMB8_9ACTN|nr:hypothetical protein [Actinopolymorpha pittospori]MBE1603305.1 hypothetical protein [Actinopolymorpha pittospori]
MTHLRESALTESDWQRIGRSPIPGWNLDIINDASTTLASVRACRVSPYGGVERPAPGHRRLRAAPPGVEAESRQVEVST